MSVGSAESTSKIDSMIITRPLNSAALMGLIILFVSFYNPALLIVDTIWSGA